MKKQNEILIYQTDDGQTKVSVLLDDDAVWLNQEQMGALFEKSKATISEHISNIFQEGELQENSVVRNFRTTASDHKVYDVKFYNLDDFLKISDKELLTHAGSISADAAVQKAEDEFQKYRIERDKKMVSDFDLAVKELEKTKSGEDQT